ncbi:MAG: acylphosphatase [Bacillota bacterium]
MKKSFRAVVSGRVLGVDFRSRIQRKATALGLTGYVRALPDCSLEVVAQGGSDELASLAAYLRTGPKGASVESLSIEWGHQPADDWRFTIRCGE